MINVVISQPSVWAKPRNNITNLRQVGLPPPRSNSTRLTQVFQNWFPGVHQNIGGGYPDQGESNITLAWMMAQVEPFLEFDEDYILDQYDQTEAYYRNSGQKRRPWSFGKIYNSMTGVYVLGGRETRTPVGCPFEGLDSPSDADRKGLVLPS